MQPDSSERAECLFLAAVDLPPREQAEFLDSACGGNPELRALVDALLASDRGSAEAILAAVHDEATLLFEPDLSGERIGAYRVVREIGHGGMGAVYLATRDDNQYRKQVAIKVVKRGMDTDEILARFHRERQILANLDHPYIARLLDAGTTGEGRPFFVMEYVEGEPIDVFCHENQLDTQDVCRLFLRVCDAVAHAHRNLIVHRDLKPGNILVSADGTPKLLDFGVAKLLSSDDANDFTATMVARPFTPEYASPEQVLGSAVTTATDVYALGAVFFELLTGRRAQTVGTHAPEDVRRAVCDLETVRPSRFEPKLDTDLDNIVLMAMRKEPERRYPTVDRFAGDIRRHMEGWPISARQDSVLYVARKFARRYSLQVTAATVVFFCLLAGVAISTAQSRRAEAARRIAEQEKHVAESQSREARAAREAEARERAIADQQRDEAQHERERAEQRAGDLIELANRTLFDIHGAIQSLPGAVAARQQLVKTTLSYLERLENEGSLDDRMRLVLSAAYYKTGMIQGDPLSPSLQQFAAAQASFRKAESLLAPLYRNRGNDPDLMLRSTNIQISLAEMDYRLGRSDLTIERSLKLVPVAHRLAMLRPGDLNSAKQESVIESQLARVIGVSDTARSLEHARRQVALVRDLASRFPDDADVRQELGSGLGTLAGRLTDTGDLQAAAAAYQESIGIREKMFAADPHNVALRRGLLIMYANYAGVLGTPFSPNLGRTAEAREYYAKAVAIARESSAADPQDGTARYDLAVALSRQGEVDPAPGGLTESIAILKEAVAMMEAALQQNPKSLTIVSQLSLAREYLGHRLMAAGQIDEAAGQYRQSLAEAEVFANTGNTSLISQRVADHLALAKLYASTGDRTSALDSAHRGVSLAETSYAAARADTATARFANAYFTLASVERDFGGWAHAREAAEKGLELWKSIRNPGIVSLYRESAARTEALLREAAQQQ